MDSQQLTRLATLYASHRRLSMASVGTYAARDASFFGRLEQGRVTIRRLGIVAAWFACHWPADLPWPSDIPRPAPQRDAA